MEKDVYYYQYDYLSNVRAVVREDGAVVEENNYYPYGLLYPDNKYYRGMPFEMPNFPFSRGTPRPYFLVASLLVGKNSVCM